MGGTILFLPNLFLKSGIILSMIILIIFAYISYKTCLIFLYHMKDEDKDINDPIFRILGTKWYKCSVVIMVLYSFFVNILYYFLLFKCFMVIYLYLQAFRYYNLCHGKK